jgi:hypothetical protein
MSEIWSKYSKRIMAVLAAAVVALLAIFNEAVVDIFSGSSEPVVETPAEETPAEAVVEEVSE